MHSLMVPCQAEGGPSRSWRHVRKYLWPCDMMVIESALGLGTTAGSRYVQRTEVVDLLYFPGSSANAPLELTFEDGMGVEHRVKLTPKSGKDKFSLVLPLPLDVFKHHFLMCRGLQWHGAGVTKKTCVDARSTVVKCIIQYEPRSLLHAHGLRIRTVSYELESGQGGAKAKDELAAWEMKYWKVVASQAQATVENDDGCAWTYQSLLRRASEPKKKTKRASGWNIVNNKSIFDNQSEGEGSKGEDQGLEAAQAVEESDDKADASKADADSSTEATETDSPQSFSPTSSNASSQSSTHDPPSPYLDMLEQEKEDRQQQATGPAMTRRWSSAARQGQRSQQTREGPERLKVAVEVLSEADAPYFQTSPPSPDMPTPPQSPRSPRSP